MKQGLELKLGQHLAMTPQLQQAIRLLQLSTLDLQQEVQTMLESNPLLDTEDEGLLDPDLTPSAPENVERQVEMDADAVLPAELPVDSQWEEIYDLGGSGSPAGDEELPDFEARNSREDSLQDYLRWQANLTNFTPSERDIAELIIDAIDDSGYLGASVADLAETLVLDLESVEAVLVKIQDFDPPGVAARTLGECLSLQLQQLPDPEGLVDLARRLVEQHLELLGKHDYTRLAQVLGVDGERLRQAVQLVESLNPKPGADVGGGSAEYVVPDVLVRWVGKRLRVELNPEAMPRLRINAHYAGMAGSRDAAQRYVQDQLTEARWFIKSLLSRQETILKVATAIVERQREYFLHGPESMRPMVLRDIAEEVEMHESTISRVTNQKYMMTPRGLLEFKYFFSSHVATDKGGAASATAIRAVIQKLVHAEDTRHPLSDADIAKVLTDQGIQIARRTVAKYREGANIPPASQRRRL